MHQKKKNTLVEQKLPSIVCLSSVSSLVFVYTANDSTYSIFFFQCHFGNVFFSKSNKYSDNDCDQNVSAASSCFSIHIYLFLIVFDDRLQHHTS